MRRSTAYGFLTFPSCERFKPILESWEGVHGAEKVDQLKVLQECRPHEVGKGIRHMPGRCEGSAIVRSGSYVSLDGVRNVCAFDVRLGTSRRFGAAVELTWVSLDQ